MKMKKKKKKNEIMSTGSGNLFPSILPQKRRGWFEEGIDKLGRPFEKKLDEDGLYTKKEILKDGTRKLTIKKKP